MTSDPHLPPDPYAPPRLEDERPVPLVLPGAWRLAKRGARLRAASVDGVLILLPILLCLIPTLIGQSSEARTNPWLLVPRMIVFGSLALLWIGGLTIFQIYRLASTGQTLGKKWARVRVAQINGAPVTFWNTVVLRVVVPGLIGVVPYLGMIFSIMDVLFIFREDRRCIHDHIAGTVVVVVE